MDNNIYSIKKTHNKKKYFIFALLLEKSII
jgi:hypothetical protein